MDTYGLSILAISLGALANQPPTAVAPTDTAFYGCSGGVTGGGVETGITGRGEMLVWDHLLPASHPEYQSRGLDSAAAVEIFRELERVRFRAMKPGEPSNATCTVAISGPLGRHEVMFETGSVPAKLQPVVRRFDALASHARSDNVPRLPDSASRAAAAVRVPAVRGLTLVSALHFPDGDRENRVVLTDVTPEGVTYDWWFDQTGSNGTQRGQGEASRFVSANDLAGAPRLNAIFVGQGRQETPGYTAVTISRSTFGKVLALGQTPYAVTELQGGPGASSALLPSRLVYRGNLMLTSHSTDSIPVLLDGRRTKLPSLHLHGAFALQEKVIAADYWVLSDSTHPLILKTVIGTDVFQMIRIDRPEPPQDRVTAQLVELEKNCRLELPGVYFAFNNAELEAASEPAILGAATMIRLRSNWTFTIEGHTDSIGNAQANVRLSIARAEAVRAALLRQPGVAGARLSAIGFGASHPRESNATIEGRARNRRVELARDCAGGR